MVMVLLAYWDAFERHTSNGSGLFSFLDSDFAQIFWEIVSTGVKTLSTNKIVASRYITKKRASLPVDVCRSKTPLLQLHITGVEVKTN